MSGPGALFVIALPRSYSTVACAMLGQHPQLYGIPETNLFLVDTMHQWWRRYGDRRSAGLFRTVAELFFGGQDEERVECAEQWLRDRRECLTDEVFKEIAECVYPKLVVEKTPLQGAHAQIWASLWRRLRAAPNTKLLHLIRHPRGYGQSYAEFYQELTGDSLLSAMREPAELWYRTTLLTLRFVSLMNPSRYMRMRGEDLLIEPDRMLKEIVTWMGVRNDDFAIDCMKHPERSPFAHEGPTNARLGGDPKFLESPSLRRPNVSELSLEGPLSWRNDGLGFPPKLKTLARQLGYQ